MTCPRPGCCGLVIPYRDSEIPGWPVYCVNCGWYGDRHDVTQTDALKNDQVLIARPLPKPDGYRRPRISPEERARRAEPGWTPDEKLKLFRAKMSQAMRAYHARKGHKLSQPPSMSS